MHYYSKLALTLTGLKYTYMHISKMLVMGIQHVPDSNQTQSLNNVDTDHTQ